jgi:hypothetical protein
MSGVCYVFQTKVVMIIIKKFGIVKNIIIGLKRH